MPRRTYSRQDSQLLDALFRLIASCGKLVAQDSVGQALPASLQRRLDRVSRELSALGLLSKIIADRAWRQERTSIRGGRSENIGDRYSKAIPIIADAEQPPSHP